MKKGIHDTIEKLTIRYKGKLIETNALYRFIISDDLKTLNVTKRYIKSVTGSRIIFKKGLTVGIHNINTVANGRIVYLPKDDPKEAIRLLTGYYDATIRAHEEKIVNLRELRNSLDGITYNYEE